MTDAGRDAAARWGEELAAWAIPDELRERTEDDPWRLDVASFVAHAEEAEDATTPSVLAARAALPPGGTVLDVGCGAGAASVPLLDLAGRVVGVDERPDMLDAFLARVAERDVTTAAVLGRWPDVAEAAGPADVGVAHHLAYNLPDLGAALAALQASCRYRVVIELTAEHPLAWTRPYWAHVWGLQRPSGPTAADAAAVAAELGVDISVEDRVEPSNAPTGPELVATLRRHLCLLREEQVRVEQAVAEVPPPGPRRVVTLWWDAG